MALWKAREVARLLRAVRLPPDALTVMRAGAGCTLPLLRAETGCA